MAEVPSEHLERALRLVARGLGRFTVGRLRGRYPNKWAQVAARIIGAKGDALTIERRLTRDAHAVLKVMLAQWDVLSSGRLGERQRAWTLELYATRNAWAHHEGITARDVLRTLDVAELLLLAVDAPEARVVRRLTAEVKRRGRVRRTLLTAVTAAAGTIMVLALALGWFSEHSAGRLPSSLAGRWPGGSASEILYISNLTKKVPFSEYVPASSGDILLARTRIAVKPDVSPVARYGVALYARARGVRAALVRATVDDPRPYIPPTEWSTVVTMPPALRLRTVPNSTRLLDADGVAVRDLASPSRSGGVRTPRLARGGVYYVDSRLRATPVSSRTKGQISTDGPFDCGRGRDPRFTGVEVRPGDLVRCRIRLHNLGPRTLANVNVRVDTALIGKGIQLTAMATAADADPPTTTFSNSSSLPRVIRTVRQVPWSTESLTASRALEGGLPGNPLRAKVAMGELRPGPENARYFQFAFRIE